jgi:multidrug resistance protein MdtO
MATLAQSLPASSHPLVWLRDFLKEELKPYPGRADTVYRMVFAATVVMLLTMVFRIPYGFLGVIFVLLITRESPRATLHSSAAIFLLGGIATAYVLVSARLVINLPVPHFLWIVVSLFLDFYVLSAITNYAAASTFAVVMTVAVPLWDRHMPAESNVEDTLWLVFAVSLGALVTTLVELALVRMKPGDDLVLPVAERLAAVESLLLAYANNRRPDDATVNNIIRLDIVGTARLRPVLRRSDYAPHYRAQMSGVVVAVGRLVDLTAPLTEVSFDFTDAARQKLGKLAAAVARLRSDLVNRRIPASIQFDADDGAAYRIPWLREMENLVSLIPQAFVGSQSIETHRAPSDELPQSRLIAPDAFVNP